jgi:hypothetical protein
MEYIFTLKYQLAEQDRNHDAIVERLAQAGCDDALIGVGQVGRIALEFTREADSAEQALISALNDVKQALPTAKLVEAAPDFVGLTDVAVVLGMTRQNMRKLMVSHAASFPAPIHEGSAAVWHLADLLLWLEGKGTYALEQAVIEMAQATKQINLAKQALQLVPRVQREVRALVA